MSSSFPTFPLPATQFHAVEDGTKLAYSLVPAKANQPAKAPVVLFIGWTGVKEDWDGLPAFLSSLGHSVLVFDNRGMGESLLLESTKQLSFDIMAADAASLIRHVFPSTASPSSSAASSSASSSLSPSSSLNTNGVHLFGISMGGMLAQFFAAKYPELVLSLILGCTTIAVKNPINPPAVSVIDIPPLEADATQAQKRALVVTLLGANYTPAWLAANQEYFQFKVDESMKYSRPLKGGMLQYRAIGAWNGAVSADRINKIPTLIIHGTLDAIIPVAQAHVLKEKLPSAELVLLKDVGHLFWTQEVKATQVAVQTFLQNQEQARQKALQQQLSKL